MPNQSPKSLLPKAKSTAKAKAITNHKSASKQKNFTQPKAPEWDTPDFWADLKIKLHKTFLVSAELVESDLDDLVPGMQATQKIVVWKYVQALNKRLQRDIFFSPELCDKMPPHLAIFAAENGGV